MRFFYCPKCGKEQISNDNLYKKECTVTNLRDGYGRFIHHYKCECGNYLAGWMDVAGWKEDSIPYVKSLITDYNEGGCFYYPELLEQAKYCYEKRHETR